MPEAPMRPLDRRTFDAATLMRDHPPRWADRNKALVYEISTPAGSRPGGTIEYTRWGAPPLPESIELDGAVSCLDIRDGFFDYAPPTSGRPPTGARATAEWHLNFAHPHVFAFYSSGLFAQDEMQVAEHPALGSLREALSDSDARAVTLDGHRPTPILVRGVERRCRISTEPNAAKARPRGLYGNEFALAPAKAVRAATRRIDPPTISNILAISALPGGHDEYTEEDIRATLLTAYSGFHAALLESREALGVGGGEVEVDVVVHTGHWGGGAFGGDRTLMAVLQIVAASMAGLSRLVYHVGSSSGRAPVEDALAFLASPEVAGSASTDAFIDAVVARGFRWGIGDGN